MKITAIIPIAGIGRRFGGEMPKQYFTINGLPIIAITINKVLAVNMINTVILAVAVAEVGKIKEIIKKYCDSTRNIEIVIGGKHRQDSVYNALAKVENDTDIVLVHDGVRPLIESKIISQSIKIAKQTGACVVAVPAKDTIKEVSESKVIKTLPRDHLVQVQTPQTFKYKILRQAHDKAKQLNYYAMDESALVEWIGFPVTILEGSYDNIKITTKNDLKIAKVLVSTA